MYRAFNSFRSNLQLFSFYISVHFHNSMSRWSRGIAPAAYRSQSTGNECSVSHIFYRKNTHTIASIYLFSERRIFFLHIVFHTAEWCPNHFWCYKKCISVRRNFSYFSPTAILVLYYLHFLFTFPVLAYHAARKGKTTSFKDTETVFTY